MKRLKVLVNATTLVMGGALQAASSLFTETSKDSSGIEWHWLISSVLRDELLKMSAELSPQRVTVFERTPARHSDARREVLAAERDVDPDIVFTLFGPAYVKFRATHLCGVADGWVTHGGLTAYRKLRHVSLMLKMAARVAYKSYWFRRADAWVVEAKVARTGLIRRHRLPAGAIHVVPNSCGAQFYKLGGVRPFPSGRRVRILSMSAYYESKNLESIPEVARELRKLRPDLSFEFVLTLPPDGAGAASIKRLARHHDVQAHVTNIGPVAVARAAEVYQGCDIVFLPSVLETFSANFPEAMAMGLPIVTTDFAFNRDICGDAALYYRSKDVRAAAAALSALLEDPVLWSKKVQIGKDVLATLPNPGSKLSAYISCLRALQE